ncbi:Pumilio [Rhynchospora pubera]|uniref:Pumilio n=1 Tax=Rhynchospora pubera TaxID=906938 RepID=A0AAV8H9I3_9POAL|nr:Pumilio [Rhynchospora pubera]
MSYTSDGKHMEEEVSQLDSTWESIFSNTAFAPPMLSEEERENLQKLTCQAAETLKSKNKFLEDSIVDVIAPQLACLIAMPLSSSRSQTGIQLELCRPLDRCKSGDTALKLCEVIGHAEEFSFDQKGSRFIQEKLETATNEEKDIIFQEIRPLVMNLIIDMFGNFVIQKYFDYGSLEQIRELADILLGNVVNLTVHKYGCRVLQTALEVVDMDKRVSIAKELDGHVIQCSCDQHGNHVVSKIIECVPQELIDFIISSLSAEITSLSAHPYGHHVIQTLLECCDEASDRIVMVRHILQDLFALSHDQYGNYIIQHILENGKPQERSAIIQILSGNVLKMSKHKFASNVIEKGLRFGTPQEQCHMVDEILRFTNECDTLQMMAYDQYGNCLVQTALEVSNSEQLVNMISRIIHYLNVAKRFTYELSFISMIEKLIQTGG